MQFFLILLFVPLLFGCQSGNTKKVINTTSNSTQSKVELFYFHQTKGCKTCKAVGKLSKEFVSKNFDSQKKYSVIYHDVNISLAENKALADQFEVNWSGLCILAHTSKGIVKEDITDIAFIYALNNPDSLKQILRTKINNYLIK
jgi:thiol-disulfide isomerase/thioredoxin